MELGVCFHAGTPGEEALFTLLPSAHSNMINALKDPALIEDDVVKQKLNTKINDFIRPFLQNPANCHCKVIKI